MMWAASGSSCSILAHSISYFRQLTAPALCIVLLG